MFDAPDDSIVVFSNAVPADILAGYLAAPLWAGTIALAYLFWRFVRGLREDVWGSGE